jgi:hypothetical protein
LEAELVAMLIQRFHQLHHSANTQEFPIEVAPDSLHKAVYKSSALHHRCRLVRPADEAMPSPWEMAERRSFLLQRRSMAPDQASVRAEELESQADQMSCPLLLLCKERENMDKADGSAPSPERVVKLCPHHLPCKVARGLAASAKAVTDL